MYPVSPLLGRRKRRRNMFATGTISTIRYEKKSCNAIHIVKIHHFKRHILSANILKELKMYTIDFFILAVHDALA